MKQRIDWRLNKDKAKIQIEVTGKDLALFEDFFILGGPCKSHRNTPPENSFVSTCAACQDQRQKEVLKMQLRVFRPMWEAYLKKTKKKQQKWKRSL